MRRAYFLVGLVAILLAAWALRSVDWRAVLAALMNLKPDALARLLIVDAAITGLFSARWWLILRSQGHGVAYLSLAAYRLAGFAVSYFTPGTQFGGEPLQIYLLGQRHNIPAAAALASVTFDKLLELLANFAFLVLGAAVIALGGLPGGFSSAAALVLVGLLFTGLAGYSVALWLGHAPLGWLLRKLSGWVPVKGQAERRFFRLVVIVQRAAQVVATAEGQIHGLCRQAPFLVLQATGLAVVIWGAVIFEFWLCLNFLGIPATLVQAISLLTVARLAFLSPLPGALGAFEAGQVYAFAALGFPPAAAIALSLFIRARDVSLGLLGLAVGAQLISIQQPINHLPSTIEKEILL